MILFIFIFVFCIICINLLVSYSLDADFHFQQKPLQQNKITPKPQQGKIIPKPPQQSKPLLGKITPKPPQQSKPLQGKIIPKPPQQVKTTPNLQGGNWVQVSDGSEPSTSKLLDKLTNANAKQVVSYKGEKSVVNKGVFANIPTINIDGQTFGKKNGKLYYGNVVNGKFVPLGTVNSSGQLISSSGTVKRDGSQLLGALATGVAVGGAIGGPAGAAIGAAVGTFGSVLNNFLMGPQSQKQQSQVGQSVAIVNETTGKVQTFNVNPNGVYEQCIPQDGTQPQPRSGEFRFCAKHIANAIPAVWNGIVTNLKGRVPVRYLSSAIATLGPQNLLQQSLNNELTYYDYIQNMAKYLPNENPIPYSDYISNIFATAASFASLSASGTYDNINSISNSGSGVKTTPGACIAACVNAGKQSLYTCGLRCRLMLG
jgi:hypothetical protein